MPLRIAFLLAALLATWPRDTGAQAANSGDPGPFPSHGYYIVTGIDPRMCPSPLCGGVYVSLVDRKTTRCADGTVASRCYAPILDWSALGLPADRLAQVQEAFYRSKLIARGKLALTDTPYGRLATFVASDAWLGVTGSVPTPPFHVVRPSGIVCIAAPCPTLRDQRLNRLGVRALHDLDLAASGATPEQIESGLTALHQGSGLLVSGALVPFTGPAGRGARLVASEFYAEVVAAGGNQ